MCVTCTTHTYISNSFLEPKATEAKAKTLYRKGKFCKEKPKKFVEKENNQRIQKKNSRYHFRVLFRSSSKEPKTNFPKLDFDKLRPEETLNSSQVSA